MTVVTNFDDLKRLHAEARIRGAGSKAWIEFATVMMDSFPSLYDKAKAINARVSKIGSNDDLIKVATGQVRHLYNGECPDEVEGPNVRDPDCPACQVLLAAATST